MFQKRGKICLATEKSLAEAKGNMSKVENETSGLSLKIVIRLEISG